VSIILVIDEQGIFRSGIRQLIEARVQHTVVVAGSAIKDFAADQRYDLVLIDVGSLNDRVSEWLKTVRDLAPATRFAILSSSKARADVLDCLSAGFHGFVQKLQPDDELLAAIKDLLSGRVYVPRWLAAGDDDGSLSPAPSTSVEVERLKLTRRQHDILPLIAQGMSNKEISSRLNIAEGTTKIHVTALIRALGARSRTEAAFIAARLIGSNNPRSGSVEEAKIRAQRFKRNRRTVSERLGPTDRGTVVHGGNTAETQYRESPRDESFVTDTLNWRVQKY
jgi:DNA-binding NarL/FixJ family response regulator